MRIKIFVPNEYGRIELTKEELEKLLNESYQQGWADKPERPYYYQTYPYVTYCGTSTSAINTTLTESTSSTTALADEAMNMAKEEIKDVLENAYKVELK